MSFASVSSNHLVYIGPGTRAEPGGSRGIYALRLDGDTGKLSAPVLVAPALEPTFLALSPDRRFLYAGVNLPEASEGMKGGVSAFAIDPAGGGLTALNTQPSGGNVPLHLAVDRTGRVVVMVNYGTGTVASFPIGSDGRLGGCRSFLTLTGSSGARPQRQTSPFPHSVTVSPDNRHVYVAALGQDKVLRFELAAATATLALVDAAAHTSAPGAGPRHATFSADGRFYYSLNELDGTVDVLAHEAASGRLMPVQTIAGLPADFQGKNTSAEIRLHPNGKFLYTSNRGHDSLAVFARDEVSGRLALVEIVPSGGGHPRNFALSPDGAWLLCANRDANNVVVFAVDPASGRLTRTGEEATIDRPVCVLFWN